MSKHCITTVLCLLSIYDYSKGYKEQQNLVVLHGTNKSSKGNKEEEDPHSNDATHHLEARHQPKTLPPGSDANHQQAHHLTSGSKRGVIIKHIKILNLN